MAPTLAPAAPSHVRHSLTRAEQCDHPRVLEDELLDRTIAITRELRYGVRSASTVNAAKDLKRKGRPSIARWLTLMLKAVKEGTDARIFGEMLADLLGAAVATVLPVGDASLAECLAESYADPIQVLADRADATAQQCRDAARAMRAEARTAIDAARAYDRRARELEGRGLVA